MAIRPAEMLGAPRKARGRFLAQLGEGLSYALRTRDVCLIVILLAALGTFGFNFNIFVPLLARYVLETGPVGFGVLFSFLGAGAVASALLLASRREATERAVVLGAAGFTLLLFLVALSPWFVLTAGLMALLGATSTLFSASSNARLQLIAPPELRGRLMSIYSLLFMGSTPIGGFAIGVLSEHLGVQAALAICAGLCALGGLAAWVYARRMSLTACVDRGTIHPGGLAP
jgi:MFS family permease